MKNLVPQFKLKLKQLLFIVSILFATNKSVFSQDLNLDGALRYTYSQRDIAIWDSINRYQYGVASSEFKGLKEKIGFCKAKSNLGGPWRPIDGYKHTLCGQLYLPHHGKFEERLNDDGDINFYMFPDSSFQWLLNKTDGNEWVNGTVVGEVSLKEPGQTIKTDGATYLQSLPKCYFQNLGIYGAWVWDEGHGHPEIHPIEQAWKKIELNTFTTEFHLFSMHDNQGRFTQKQQFSPESCINLPWVKNPQLNVFYLPFEVSFNGSTINYSIEQLSGNNINNNNTTGQILRLLYNGRELISVRRPSIDYPVVTFFSLGMKNENTIRGYIAIETSIGKLGPTRTHGGHLFLKVTRTTSQIQAAEFDTQKSQIKQE